MSLLEAQAAVGSIADPVTGEQMSLDEAVDRELLDDELAKLLRRAERAVTGFKPKGSDETLSLFQAMNRVNIRLAYETDNEKKLASDCWVNLSRRQGLKVILTRTLIA